MTRYKAIQKFQDKHGITIGYKLRNLDNGTLIDATSDSIKRALKNGQADITNLKLTVDGKLIYSEEKESCNKIDLMNQILKSKLLTGKAEYTHEGIKYYIEDNKIACKCIDKSILKADILPGTEAIEYAAFKLCESLQQINIPNSVTEIGDSAFQDCESLQQINIPNSVTEIGACAFSNCESLQQINIPNSVTEIRYGTFACCGSLQQINIPNNVTEIGDYAFDCCKSLKQITIPDSVNVIVYDAFEGCESLSEESKQQIRKAGYEGDF